MPSDGRRIEEVSMDIPNVPTEVMRSWVGQDVTVLAYSAGAPTIPAAGTPGGGPWDPRDHDARRHRSGPSGIEARGSRRGRILRCVERLQRTTGRYKQLRGRHHHTGGAGRLLPLARRLEDRAGPLKGPIPGDVRGTYTTEPRRYSGSEASGFRGCSKDEFGRWRIPQGGAQDAADPERIVR